MAQYQPQGIAPNGRPYSVIIAEPSKFQLKQLQQILESEGYKIIGIAETGRDLINLYKENRLVDLIFMEVSLPVMDGYAAFWEMKEQGGILPKIFFISEENSPGVIKSLLDNGAIDYMVKPIKREKVLEKAKIAIEKVNPTFK
ncbi:MAG TPA: response regulator [Leptospiraceae bacterium]|nr:response regulator [Leptospiraceae bacterium]HMW08164.1 response regulator [Leptospiraceae bacterium]HMX35152.1 response regulator [Leptospiraceae bacterium]HMY33967.1 response regulator [Leptospiraceae bacterium]HMZ67272.1 response regulator [Leptospiraceae bacterium]